MLVGFSKYWQWDRDYCYVILCKPYNALGVWINLMGEFVPNVNFCITGWVSIRTWCFGILVFIYILYMAGRLVKKLMVFSKSVLLHMKCKVQLELSGFNFSPPLVWGNKISQLIQEKKIKTRQSQPHCKLHMQSDVLAEKLPFLLVHCCH